MEAPGDCERRPLLRLEGALSLLAVLVVPLLPLPVVVVSSRSDARTSGPALSSRRRLLLLVRDSPRISGLLWL